MSKSDRLQTFVKHSDKLHNVSVKLITKNREKNILHLCI